MAAPKGHKRYGGRAKGTPNKDRLDLFAICEAHSLSPFEGMVILAKEEADPHKKFDKLERVAKYLYPIPKQVELSTEDQAGIVVSIKDYTSK